jgi:hypothetical protein
VPQGPPERGHRPARERSPEAWTASRRSDPHAEGEADLASYLLFDGTFCRRLIELGRADAQARKDELLEFFRDDHPAGGGDEEPVDETGVFGRDSLPIRVGT